MDTLRDLNHHPDTFSPDHLQCQRIARPALLHPKQGKRRKALMLEISIHSLPAPPPSHLTGYRQGAGNNSGREISGNHQILLERHTPILLSSVSTKRGVSLTRRRARGIVNWKISLCSRPGLGNGGGAPSPSPCSALGQDQACLHLLPPHSPPYTTLLYALMN